MPTGYTSGVADGKVTTLEQFAWTCARAFGALFHMRDDPADAPITEPQPSEYHLKGLAEAQSLQHWAQNATELDLREQFSEESVEMETVRLQRQEKRRLLEVRYLDMRRQVVEWDAPAEMRQLHAMMLSQLDECLRFDCRHDSVRPEPRSLDSYRGDLLVKAANDIAYHAEQIRLEAKRIEESRKWIRLLRDSLPKEVKP